jgi:hypothetical protein
MAKDSVVKAKHYLEEVGKDYHELDIPLYMFREWYSMVKDSSSTVARNPLKLV